MTLDVEQHANHLIQHAVLLGASDIHLLPYTDCYHLYFRINGQLNWLQSPSHDWAKRLINYFKYKANMDIGEKRRPQSGATHLKIEDQQIELRFSTMTDVALNESLVVRVIQTGRQQNQQLALFFPKQFALLRQLVKRKSGLILFSGPVGSGKTTTIYHLLCERVAQQFCQVITMEDPVEIREPQFLQTQINELANIHYDDLIKASLRHHPDILMIGEIRDEETARMVIRGALTGHLLIATVHAKDACGVIARLQELRITDAQLTQTLIGIVSQRLIPRYCPFCQGSCQLHCPHFHPNAKRAALLEILTGSALQQQLLTHTLPANYQVLNHHLRKAWSYGYLDTSTFTQFEVV